MKGKFKYIFLFFIILIYTIFLPIDLDEIWNYGFLHSIYNGLIPYKDFNMVITPLFHYLSGLPFIFIKSNILIILIENSIMFVLIYYFMNKLIGDKANLLILFPIVLYSLIYFSYNNLSLLFVIILVYLEKEYNNKDYLIGFIIGLSILTKQSIGVCLIIPSIYIFIKDKDFNKLIRRIIGLLFPCIIFFISLVYLNNLGDFINLCVLGLFDFGKSNGNSDYLSISMLIITLIVNIICLIKNKDKITWLYVLSFISITVPMFDLYHVLMYTYFTLIILFMFIKYKKILNLNLLFYICSLGIVLINLYFITGFKLSNYPNKLNHFNYLYIDEYHEKETYKLIKKIRYYENEGYNIIFLSSKSYFYKIIMDEDINYYDLINTGNWGYNGSNKLYKSLLKEKNSIFITDDYSYIGNKQTDKVALKFLKRHGEFIEKYKDFKFYKYKDK